MFFPSEISVTCLAYAILLKWSTLKFNTSDHKWPWVTYEWTKVEHGWPPVFLCISFLFSTITTKLWFDPLQSKPNMTQLFKDDYQNV